MISPDYFVGAYSAKFTCGSHGNHYCNRIAAAVQAGQRFGLDPECYAYHFISSADPLENDAPNFIYSTGPIDICVRDDEH